MEDFKDLDLIIENYRQISFIDQHIADNIQQMRFSERYTCDLLHYKNKAVVSMF